MMRREWEGGKPKRITGVGSTGLAGDDDAGEVKPKRGGMTSGGGEGAKKQKPVSISVVDTKRCEGRATFLRFLFCVR
jgi:hypothetical protein